MRVQDKFQTRSDAIRRYLSEDQPQSVSKTSQEEKRQDISTVHSHPSQCHNESLSAISSEKNQETWQIEALQDLLFHSQSHPPSNTSQETGQGQQPMEASLEHPGEKQLPFTPQSERENSIVSSQGSDIPYDAAERDRASPAALEKTGGYSTQFDGPISQKHTLSTVQNIPTERDDIDMLDDSSVSTDPSDARSTMTPNTEIMPDVRPTTSSNRLPVPDSQRTGLENIPIATNGNPMPPSADERENGYYFIESLKLHGTPWKQIVPLYAHRFNVVRSTNGLQQHWMRWRDQGRKLTMLKYRHNQRQTRTTAT